ncbi:Cytochrome c [Roseivivax lentus]|uniref:Cytochrome c n=1 Tax=Roseivivax lentus TaxID=633194 RepID=A0A1N7NED1_9RHOB|nr:cytochrome c [Roseivivax lentus]SIS96715.1 Cytochrome c [Roseivivax lentus]
MRRLLVLSICLSVSFLWPVALAAQDLEAGEALFTRHCATCHGLDATGGGPMAPALLIQPTDLTALSAAEDGKFPLVRVVMRIDGRDPLIAHGSPMPVYGDFFEGVQSVALKTASGQPVMMPAPIADIAAYLMTLQD